jgi:lysophospholipase L1-like esterase
MKSVLCYGDSLTWGSVPDGQGRHSFEDRWPNAMAAKLPGVEVVADGLRGRTTCYDQHPSPADLNGGRLLPSALHTHAPLDLVIIMLGTNDSYLEQPAAQAGRGIERLIEIIRHHPWRQDAYGTPDILLVAPPAMIACEAWGISAQMIANSRAQAGLYAQIANKKSVGFFDANTVAQCSPEDGLHLDADNTRALGEALAPVVKARL